MKKIILMFIAVITLISCDCCYCPICGEYGNDCRCNNNSVRYSGGDYFCAETLLGTWQCDYNTIIDYKTIKQIKFFSNRLCDITYSEGINPDWYTDTYTYSYANGYIRFSRNGSTFSFKVDGFLFPELSLSNSFNKYTWRKVKAYGC